MKENVSGCFFSEHSVHAKTNKKRAYLALWTSPSVNTFFALISFRVVTTALNTCK